MAPDTVQVSKILGFESDPSFAERLHTLQHQGSVEYLELEQEDTRRHRLRAKTDRGTECLIALPRDQSLSQGAVIFLTDDRAVVVRLQEERWLYVKAADPADALELGYFAGNLHWRVRFSNGALGIALEGPVEDYLARLQPFVSDNRAEVLLDD